MGVSTSTVEVRCASCDATQRVPATAGPAKAKCGECGAELPGGVRRSTGSSGRAPTVTTSGRITATGIPTKGGHRNRSGLLVTGLCGLLVLAGIVAFFL